MKKKDESKKPVRPKPTAKKWDYEDEIVDLDNVLPVFHPKTEDEEINDQDGEAFDISRINSKAVNEDSNSTLDCYSPTLLENAPSQAFKSVIVHAPKLKRAQILDVLRILQELPTASLVFGSDVKPIKISENKEKDSKDSVANSKATVVPKIPKDDEDMGKPIKFDVIEGSIPKCITRNSKYANLMDTVITLPEGKLVSVPGGDDINDTVDRLKSAFNTHKIKARFYKDQYANAVLIKRRDK